MTIGKGESGERKVAYHDSCYLGRHNLLYEEPRDVLRSIPGFNVVEAERHALLGLCCGAGGGRMWLEEKQDQRVNHLRAEQLFATGASTWATACPYCKIMLDDAVHMKKLADHCRVADFAELLIEAIHLYRTHRIE